MFNLSYEELLPIGYFPCYEEGSYWYIKDANILAGVWTKLRAYQFPYTVHDDQYKFPIIQLFSLFRGVFVLQHYLLGPNELKWKISDKSHPLALQVW